VNIENELYWLWIKQKLKWGNNYMKYFILIIVMVFITNTEIFSQENNNGLLNLFSGNSIQKNAISIDFGTLIWDLSTGGFGIGISYERSVHNMFSVMGHFSYSYHDWNYLAFEFHGRWYPFGTSLEKLFAMVNLGYGVFWNSNMNYNWTLHTLKISPKIGWKLLFCNEIFIEPVIGYGFPFVLNENKNDLDISKGLGIGLNIGLAF
jgi:hypothetical protein